MDYKLPPHDLSHFDQAVRRAFIVAIVIAALVWTVAAFTKLGWI